MIGWLAFMVALAALFVWLVVVEDRRRRNDALTRPISSAALERLPERVE